MEALGAGGGQGGEGRGEGGEVGGQVMTVQGGCAWSAVGSRVLIRAQVLGVYSLTPLSTPTWEAPGRPTGEETGASRAWTSGMVSTREHGIALPGAISFKPSHPSGYRHTWKCRVDLSFQLQINCYKAI